MGTIHHRAISPIPIEEPPLSFTWTGFGGGVGWRSVYLVNDVKIYDYSYNKVNLTVNRKTN